MELWFIFLFIYAVVACFSLYMTCMEQRRQEDATVVSTLLGYVLCVFWPLMVLALSVMVRHQPAGLVRAKID